MAVSIQWTGLWTRLLILLDHPNYLWRHLQTTALEDQCEARTASGYGRMASSRKITLKVQVHPSHCGLDWQAEASYHTQRKGKSDCWSCWLFTVHALKVHKYPFPIPEHSYIFTATSCLPGLVYIRSESLDVFSAFRGSLGGSSSQIHWVDTCTVSIAICILQSLAASCHMKSMFGSKVWMERFMLYISSNLFASPINKFIVTIQTKLYEHPCLTS